MDNEKILLALLGLLKMALAVSAVDFDLSFKKEGGSLSTFSSFLLSLPTPNNPVDPNTI